MKKLVVLFVLLGFAIILGVNNVIADSLSHSASFTLRDGLDCSLSPTPVDGIVDCEGGVDGWIANSSFIGETFYEFNLSGLDTASYVRLILTRSAGHVSKELPITISYYVGNGSTDMSVFGGGTLLTSLVIDTTDSWIVTPAVDVTPLFNDFIVNSKKYLGFRLHTDAPHEVVISDALLIVEFSKPHRIYADITSLRDINGNGVEEVVALRTDLTGRPEVVIKDSGTNEIVNYVPFHGPAWTPIAVATIDASDDSVEDVAVLAVEKNNGTINAQIRNALTAEKIIDIPFFTPAWKAKDLTALDSNGDGINELGVLALEEKTDIVTFVTKDVRTKQELTNISLSNRDYDSRFRLICERLADRFRNGERVLQCP